MWKHITFLLVCFCITTLGYTLPQSNDEVNYRYEPPTGVRLELPSTSSNLNYHAKSSQRQFRQYRPKSEPQTMTLTNQGYASESSDVRSSIDESKSQSVRLPLPLGVASINIAPLPLMEGASYTASHGLTSYGTTYPQRL